MSRIGQTVGWFSGKKVRIFCAAMAVGLSMSVSLALPASAQTPAPPAAAPEDTVVCETKSNIAWLLCPVINATNEAVAALYGFIIDRLQFGLLQPVADDQNGLSGLSQANWDNLRKSWGTMTKLASGLLIGVLVLIIMGQSMAGFNFMDAYTAKRMLPRLVFALVLINGSWYLVALGIEIGNIAGGAVRDLIIAPFKTGGLGTASIVADPGAAGSAILLGLLLAGLLAFVLGPGILAVAPLLLGVGLAVLMGMVFVVLRQGLLMLLIVSSPLAFLLYILPGTQKYFNFWQNALTGAILIYPIFQAVVAIGAVMAIITGANANADPNNPGAFSVFFFVIAVLCYFAPFFALPYLVKFSGGILGRLGGMLNNPNKGIIDRTRNWNKERRSRMPTQLARAQRKQQRVADAQSRAAMRYGNSGFRRWRSAPGLPGAAALMDAADRRAGLTGVIGRGIMTAVGGRQAARAAQDRRDLRNAGEAEAAKQLEGMNPEALNDYLASGGNLQESIRRTNATRPTGRGMTQQEIIQRQQAFQKIRNIGARNFGGGASPTFAAAALSATAKAGRLNADAIAGARAMYGAGGARSTTRAANDWNAKVEAARGEAVKAGQVYQREDAEKVTNPATLRADSLPTYFDAIGGGRQLRGTTNIANISTLDPTTGLVRQTAVQSFGARGDMVATRVAQAFDQPLDPRQISSINQYLDARVGAVGTAERLSFDTQVNARRTTRT